MYTIDTLRIKLFGKMVKVSRVLKGGEVVHVAGDQQEAQAWIDQQV